MESETVASATPTPTESTPTEAPAELSIAEHEAQFGRNQPEEPASADPPIEKPRHRAKSQQARASDVEDISSWTKRLREAEDAIPIAKKDGESDRVYQLRRRAEIAELAKTFKAQPTVSATQQPTAPKSEPVAPRTVTNVPAATGKPTWGAFEAKIGKDYASWGDAQDAYVDARDEWREGELVRQQAEKQVEQAQQASQQRDREQIDGHKARMAARLADPAYAATTAGIRDMNLPTPMLRAIASHDKGVDFVEALAKDPDLLDTLFLSSYKKDPYDDDLVATLQRRLLRAVQAGTTGSAAIAPPTRTAPRPPNPVRTGPLTPTDEPPGDDASVAEHERYYGRKRRR